MRTLYILALLVSTILILPESAEAQGFVDHCLGGTTYYVALPDTTTNTFDARFPDDEPEDFVLMLYSPVDQQVRIGRVNSAALTLQLKAGVIEEFDTKRIAVPIVTEINQPVTNKVLKITADEPIIVYAYMTSRFGAAGFTPLPVEEWGEEYFAATWPGVQVRNIYPAGRNYDASERKAAPAMITIIAAYDNTQVTIGPTGGLAQCSSCQKVTLNEGDAYQVHSYVDLGDVENQEDIAGSYISATKPIGLFSGNTRTSVDPITLEMLAGNSPLDLMAEWLTPIEMHGTEFVFTPTWDKLRQRDGIGPEREAENVRIIAGIDTTWVRSTDPANVSGDPALDTAIAPDPFHNWRLRTPTEGRMIYTDKPAQAFHAINSVAEFYGRTGSGSDTGASYRAWGSAMVGLVPRERWTSFAPFRVPTNPSQMSNFVNVVTDTNHRFGIYLKSGKKDSTQVLFERSVNGSDLVWTTISLNPGITYQLIGNNGAEFTGHTYGLYEDGFEIFRPIGIGEYEENVGQMYAMPLASSNCAVNTGPDEFEIEVTQECDAMLITIRALNDSPSGIKFLRLMNNPDSTFNAILEPVNPTTFRELRERAVSDLTVRIVAIDKSRDARGVLEFKDRTREGTIQRIRYTYDAERVDLEPKNILDFGSITVDQGAGARAVTVTNPLARDITVRGLGIAKKTFVIARTEPAFGWDNPLDSLVLKPGESFKVFVGITPTEENRIYEDSLVVELGCVTLRLPLRAATVQPCLFVSDLAFGTLGVNQSKTLPLEICNTGDGLVRFTDSTAGGGGAFLTWLLTEFSVPQSDIDLLRDTPLGPGECLTINVTFTSAASGNFRTVARLWATTRDCRDTSIWTAAVGVSSVDEARSAVSGLEITSIVPNPGVDLIGLRYRTTLKKRPEVVLLDARGRECPVVVDRASSEEIVLDVANLPSGLYFVRLRSGSSEVVRRLTVVR